MKKLEDIPKRNNFTVPDNYFENLESEIDNRIKSEPLLRKVTAFDIFKPYIYMAAAVMLIVGGLKLVVLVADLKSDPKTESAAVVETLDYDDFMNDLSTDDLTLYEYLNNDYEDAINDGEIISSEEDLAYVEDYLSQYYLEYELLYE